MHSPERGRHLEVCTRHEATAAGNSKEEEEIVGFVAYECRGDTAHILIVAVAESARRCGVATRLVHAVLSRARKMLLWSCKLEVREDNLAARALYARLGFAQIGSVQEGYYEDGGNALKFSCPLLPAERLQRPRTSLWWYRTAILPELLQAGLSKAEAALEV